jgi:hypothetical protein
MLAFIVNYITLYFINIHGDLCMSSNLDIAIKMCQICTLSRARNDTGAQHRLKGTMLNITKTTRVRAIRSLRWLSTYKYQPQLYLHKLPDSYSVSFSDDPKAQPVGQTWISSLDDHIAPKNFKPDTKFLPVLNEVIKDNIQDDFTYIMESKEFSGNYMPIYDLRNVPNYQRTPEVEDIYGFVYCDEDGTVKSGSFEQNLEYQLITQNGIIKLSDHLLEKLKEKLKEKL